MICVTLKPYTRACGNVTGGISDIGVFDPADIAFTQAAAVDGVLPAYTAVTLTDGATATDDGPLICFINFQIGEAEWKWKQSVKGCSVKYEHEFDFTLPQNSQALTNFQQALDNAACCCGLGIVMRTNDNKIFIAGESLVNATKILRFIINQDGSDGGSGKAYDDPNAANIVLKGDYSRNLYEYTGTWASLLALNVVG